MNVIPVKVLMPYIASASPQALVSYLVYSGRYHSYCSAQIMDRINGGQIVSAIPGPHPVSENLTKSGRSINYIK